MKAMDEMQVRLRASARCIRWLSVFLDEVSETQNIVNLANLIKGFVRDYRDRGDDGFYEFAAPVIMEAASNAMSSGVTRRPSPAAYRLGMLLHYCLDKRSHDSSKPREDGDLDWLAELLGEIAFSDRSPREAALAFFDRGEKRAPWRPVSATVPTKTSKPRSQANGRASSDTAVPA